MSLEFLISLRCSAILIGRFLPVSPIYTVGQDLHGSLYTLIRSVLLHLLLVRNEEILLIGRKATSKLVPFLTIQAICEAILPV